VSDPDEVPDEFEALECLDFKNAVESLVPTSLDMSLIQQSNTRELFKEAHGPDTQKYFY